MNLKPFLTLTLASVALAGLLAGGVRAAAPAAAATPPPTPPPIAQTPAPALPTATPLALPSGYATPLPEPLLPGQTPPPKPSGSPSPPPGNRKGIEGVWEVQIQRADKTEYTHFTLKEDGTTLSGVYRDAAGKKYPLAGTVDGQSVRLLVSMPDGTSLLLEWRLDGTTDMIGMLTSPKEEVPFTAGYRPKENWLENVSPSPGGLGGGGAPGGI
ncbi:MAG: hypothetical protein JO199_12520, partial [Candidatus Eremiobacteraeota bacterium]|nr:hypothetical protein [Candidatus Eremiobacteraeota bacterium]